MWAIRNDITNAVASEIGDMNRKIDLGNGARTMYSVTRNDCGGQIDTSVAPRDHPEKICNIIRNSKLSFTGDNKCLSVEEFVYRLGVMTTLE